MRPHRRRTSFTIFAQHILFILPFPRVLKAFPRVFQSESSEHNPGMSKHRRNLGGSSPRILTLRHESGPEFYCKQARILSCILSRNSNLFSPFFPAPQTPCPNHATFRAKIHANFGHLFPNSFSGRSTLVCVCALGCHCSEKSSCP